MKQIILFLIILYQKTLSLDHGPLSTLKPHGLCKFYPSCSQYAHRAIGAHGAMRGSILAIKRLARCHPWSAGGVDEVPSNINNKTRVTHKSLLRNS